MATVETLDSGLIAAGLSNTRAVVRYSQEWNSNHIIVIHGIGNLVFSDTPVGMVDKQGLALILLGFQGGQSFRTTVLHRMFDLIEQMFVA